MVQKRAHGLKRGDILIDFKQVIWKMKEMTVAF